MKVLVVATMLAVGAPPPGSSPLTEEQLRTYPDARGMPADVQAFIVQWQDCSHWRGEPGWDAARQRQIDEAVREVCPGVDARGRAVRTRHAAEPAVIARLREYEELGK